MKAVLGVALAKNGVKVLRMQPFVQHQGRPEGVLGPSPQQLTACPYRAARGSRKGGMAPLTAGVDPYVWALCYGEQRGCIAGTQTPTETHKAVRHWVL